jgi:hypothetical protein
MPRKIGLNVLVVFDIIHAFAYVFNRNGGTDGGGGVRLLLFVAAVVRLR